MALAVGRRTLASETQVRSQVSSYCVVTLVCAGWGSNGAGLLPVLRVFLVSIIPPLLHTHSSVYHRRYVRLLTDSVVK